MAILEINLEKPALVEEYQHPGGSPVGEGVTTESQSSGGGAGKLVGLLAVLAGVAVLAWKLKSGGSDAEQPDFESEEYEHGPEPEIGGEEGGGAKGKVAGVLGLAVALVSLALAAKKIRK